MSQCALMRSRFAFEPGHFNKESLQRIRKSWNWNNLNEVWTVESLALELRVTNPAVSVPVCSCEHLLDILLADLGYQVTVLH